MNVISILSNKGGAGKTTLAVNLAVEAVIRRKTTALIDLDPQASSCVWSDNRSLPSPSVDSIQPARLGKAIEALRDARADLVFIDTPPQTEQASLQALEYADLVLIPCRPGFLDLAAIQQTLTSVQSRKKRVLLIFNAVPVTASIGKEAVKAAQEHHIPIAPIHLSQRIAFANAMRDGLGVVEYEPTGKASEEVRTLYKFIMKELKHVAS